MKTVFTIQIEVEDNDLPNDELKIEKIGGMFAEGAEANADEDTLSKMKITSVTATYPKTIKINQPQDTLNF